VIRREIFAQNAAAFSVFRRQRRRAPSFRHAPCFKSDIVRPPTTLTEALAGAGRHHEAAGDSAMKRMILALMLFGTTVGVQSASAQDYYYAGGYPGGYPVQQQDQYPVLKKVLIGGALFGAGFLAGRVTAPQPNYYAPAVQPYPTNYRGHGHQHNHGHRGPMPVGYRGR